MIFSIIQFFWTGGWILTHNYIQQHAQLIKIPLFPSISNNVHSLNTDPRSYILQSYQYFIILSFISLLLFWDAFSLLLLIFKNRLVLIFSHCYHSSQFPIPIFWWQKKASFFFNFFFLFFSRIPWCWSSGFQMIQIKRCKPDTFLEFSCTTHWLKYQFLTITINTGIQFPCSGDQLLMFRLNGSVNVIEISSG